MIKRLLPAGLLAAIAGASLGQAFTPGNLVVTRVGDGSGALSSAATPVFLQEFTTAGAAVGAARPLPTSVNGSHRRCTVSGTATSEGFLTLSTDGTALTFQGYDATVGTSGVATSNSSTINRVVAVILPDGSIDTTTALTAYNSNNIRSTASTDGLNIWMSGNGEGVRYTTKGSSSSVQLSTTITNVRVVNVSGGQLYCSSATGAFQGVSKVGSGLPTTSGQTISLLPGFPTSSGPSNYDFWFADANTVYVADDSSSGKGIQKWTFDGSVWKLQYTLTTGLGTAGCRSVTGVNNLGVVTLYAITSDSLPKLVTVTDTGSGSAFTTLATSGANTAFRGVDFAPQVSNQAPAASNDSYSVQEDTPLNVAAPGVLSNDSDPNGDAITAELVSGPSSGSLTLNADGSFGYMPAANFNGQATFTYKAKDAKGAYSNVATVTIDVTPVDDAPIGNADSYVVTEDQTLNVGAPGVLGNDTDADGDSLSTDLNSSTSNGTLTLNSDGSFQYQPNSNYNGPDSFTYTPKDSDGTPGNTVTVSISVQSENDVPVAAPDSYEVDEDQQLTVGAPGVLGNDTDDDGDTLTAEVVSPPSSGTLTLNGDGSLSYQPAADFNGDVTFTYKAKDGNGGESSPATVTIKVKPVNDPPTLGDIPPQGGDELTELTFTAVGQDPDNDPLTYALAGEPSGASIDPATGVFTWTPTEEQGPQTYAFQVIVTDGTANASQVVTVTVAEVNLAPELGAIGDKSVDEETELSFTASATDPDLPANGLTFSLEGAPSGATIDPSTGVFSWTPGEADGPGTYTVTVKVTDDGSPALSDSETITITVKEVNKAPVLDPVSDQSIQVESTLSFTATASDPDLPANGLTFSLQNAPTGATIDPSTGEFSWTPQVGDEGVYDVTVVVTDDGSPQMSDSQVFRITVEALPPVDADPDAFSVWRGDLTSGGLSDLAQSDDLYVVIRQRAQPDASSPNAGIEALTTAPRPDIRTLSVTVESKCSGIPSGNVKQRVYLYNYRDAIWEQVDETTPSTSDVTLTETITSDASRFIDPTTKQASVRVGWYDRGTVSVNWSASIDHIHWTFTP